MQKRGKSQLYTLNKKKTLFDRKNNDSIWFTIMKMFPQTNYKFNENLLLQENNPIWPFVLEQITKKMKIYGRDILKVFSSIYLVVTILHLIYNISETKKTWWQSCGQKFWRKFIASLKKVFITILHTALWSGELNTKFDSHLRKHLTSKVSHLHKKILFIEWSDPLTPY